MIFRIRWRGSARCAPTAPSRGAATETPSHNDLDSNLIIYAALPNHAALRAFIAANAPGVSAVSYVEVLGYHKLSPADRAIFETFFQAAEILHIMPPILQQAVALRQQRSMSLGDSLVAATALVHDRTLLTHNLADFRWIPGLKLSDPLGAPSP